MHVTFRIYSTITPRTCFSTYSHQSRHSDCWVPPLNEMQDEIDTLNPEDYVIGIVQIPPGKDSKKLLDISNPSTKQFLRKFLKRIDKKSSSSLSKTLPLADGDESYFTLTAKNDSTPLVPFVGKGSDGKWYMRHFSVRRLTINPYNASYNRNFQSIEVADGGECTQMDQSNTSSSPQLVVSSDDNGDE
ncbi:unnamed protein product [Calicophoron daubneyi]|uniref:Uncharacterized protein n=1 Tax=Calicophoron daubneyi TaxID=300641 RepID=A0AAV2SZZ2_CALDB